MKKIATIGFGLAVLLAQMAFGQKLKSFQGEFNAPKEKGQATYTYYEDASTLERIMQGAFRYTNLEIGDFGTLQKNFSGNFKDGLKEGLWNYIITYKDFYFMDSREKSYYATGIISLRINYKNGSPSGTCSYNCNLKRRDLFNIRGQLRYGIFKDLNSTVIKLNFKEAVLVGSASVKAEDLDLKTQFDNNGNVNGDCTIIYTEPDIGGNGKVESWGTYKNGWKIKGVYRKLPSGKVISTFDLYDETKKVIDQIISEKISIEQLDDLGYKWEEANLFDVFPVIFNSIFNNDDFLYSSIGGDSELEIDNFHAITYTPGGGFIKTITKK